MFLRPARLATLLGLSLSAAAGAQPASIQLLPVGMTGANGITPDGAIVVGQHATGGAAVPARWVRGLGIQDLAVPPGANGAAWAVSADGLITAGTIAPALGQDQAARWSGTALVPLGGIAAFGLSADGLTVVGRATVGGLSRAVRWDSGGAMFPLPNPPGTSGASDAAAASADASVIVGQFTYPLSGFSQAVRWTAAGATPLGFMGTAPGGNTLSAAFSVTPDGSAVVGYGSTSQGIEAFRWTASGGMQPLGDLAGGSIYSLARAVSADGSVIVGTSNALSQEAFIWTAAGGMRRLRTVLETDYGLDLAGWQLADATGISPDGRFIIGTGAGPGSTGPSTWIVQIPAPGAAVLWLAALVARRGRRHALAN